MCFHFSVKLHFGIYEENKTLLSRFGTVTFANKKHYNSTNTEKLDLSKRNLPIQTTLN